MKFIFVLIGLLSFLLFADRIGGPIIDATDKYVIKKLPAHKYIKSILFGAFVIFFGITSVFIFFFTFRGLYQMVMG